MPTITKTADRYTIALDDGRVAGHATYFDFEGERYFDHTEIKPEYGGQGLASELIEYALRDTAGQGLPVVGVCPFVSGWLEKHPGEIDIEWRKSTSEDRDRLKEARTAAGTEVDASPTIARLNTELPKVYRAQVRVNTEARREAEEAGLSDEIVELVCVRVSQINGCGSCLATHTEAARRAGVSDAKLDVLAAWREIPGQFTREEYAALELAEHLTILPQGTVHRDAVIKAAEVFSTKRLAALEWTIITINSFNRVSIASSHTPKV